MNPYTVYVYLISSSHSVLLTSAIISNLLSQKILFIPHNTKDKCMRVTVERNVQYMTYYLLKHS